MVIGRADVDGNVPLWEAIVGGHDSLSKLLAENGANLQWGDVGQFACTAAEQNSLNLLKEIMRYGGDITLPSSNNGTTALHVAVSEANMEIVKFLLDHGAIIDKPDKNGWTPRDLADQQSHTEIKDIFDSTKEPNVQSLVSITERQGNNKIRYLGRFTSEPTIPLPHDGSFNGTDGSWSHSQSQSRPRRRSNNYHNSLFGVMSAAHNGDKDQLFNVDMNNNARNNGMKSCNAVCPTRVTISCPEKGEVAGKLVLLPASFNEILEMGAKKFGICPAKVVCKDGAEIEDIEVIRDGDHLVFVGASGVLESNCSAPPTNGVHI